MRRSEIAKECGNCPRGFFRLFNEQHVRRAWQHGETRRRDGVRYPITIGGGEDLSCSPAMQIAGTVISEGRGSVLTSLMAYQAADHM
jgi:hypothetical protein